MLPPTEYNSFHVIFHSPGRSGNRPATSRAQGSISSGNFVGQRCILGHFREPKARKSKSLALSILMTVMLMPSSVTAWTPINECPRPLHFQPQPRPGLGKDSLRVQGLKKWRFRSQIPLCFCIWALKPYHLGLWVLGPWTFRNCATQVSSCICQLAGGGGCAWQGMMGASVLLAMT